MAGVLLLFELLMTSTIAIQLIEEDKVANQKKNFYFRHCCIVIAEVTVAILMLVPHSVQWGYVAWRMIKTIGPYLSFWRCQTRANGETQRLLHFLIEGMSNRSTK